MPCIETAHSGCLGIAPAPATRANIVESYSLLGEALYCSGGAPTKWEHRPARLTLSPTISMIFLGSIECGA